jgi:hypothetical protein
MSERPVIRARAFSTSSRPGARSLLDGGSADAAPARFWAEPEKLLAAVELLAEGVGISGWQETFEAAFAVTLAAEEGPDGPIWKAKAAGGGATPIIAPADDQGEEQEPLRFDACRRGLGTPGAERAARLPAMTVEAALTPTAGRLELRRDMPALTAFAAVFADFAGRDSLVLAAAFSRTATKPARGACAARWTGAIPAAPWRSSSTPPATGSRRFGWLSRWACSR